MVTNNGESLITHTANSQRAVQAQERVLPTAAWRRKSTNHGASPLPSSYYPLFDYLRFLLALGVFASHSGYFTILPESLGNYCVQVFFALSGFLIAGLLLGSSPKDLPRFYFNRITRIWFPYLLAGALLALGSLAKKQPIDGKLIEYFFYKFTFVWNIFGTQQLEAFRDRMPLSGAGNHFWSICVEEQFYLLAPVVIVLWTRGRALVLGLVWLANFVYPHDFAAISLGVLLALSQKRYGDWFAHTRIRLILLLLFGLSIAGIATNVVTYTASAPIGASCLVAVLARRGKQLFLGQLLGGISYPFYLNHWVGLVLRKQIQSLLGIPLLGVTLVSLCIALCFSTALYLLVDRPILARRSRLYSAKMGKWCCSLAVTLTVIGLIGGLLHSFLAPGAP